MSSLGQSITRALVTAKRVAMHYGWRLLARLRYDPNPTYQPRLCSVVRGYWRTTDCASPTQQACPSGGLTRWEDCDKCRRRVRVPS